MNGRPARVSGPLGTLRGHRSSERLQRAQGQPFELLSIPWGDRQSGSTTATARSALRGALDAQPLEDLGGPSRVVVAPQEQPALVQRQRDLVWRVGAARDLERRVEGFE